MVGVGVLGRLEPVHRPDAGRDLRAGGVERHACWRRASLLLVYSAGLSVPFLAMGLAYNCVKPLYNRIKRYIGVMNYLSGALLIIIGILIFTDSLINLNEHVQLRLPERHLESDVLMSACARCCGSA